MISTALLRHHGLNRPSCPRASSKYVKLKPESSRESTTACATLTLKGDLAKDVSYEGDVIIYGDVHPGVCIQAAGDVTVWGRLEGSVRAGYPNFDCAVIRALHMNPQACQIAAYAGSLTELKHSRELIVDNATKSIVGVDAQPPMPHKSPLNSRKAAMFTGIYAILLGTGIMLFPETIYGLLFDLSRVHKGLIRLGGSLLTLVGIQYLGTAMSDSMRLQGECGFYVSTICSRVFLATYVAFLVAVASLEWAWLYFAGLNGAGAFFMALALQKDLNAKRETDR